MNFDDTINHIITLSSLIILTCRLFNSSSVSLIVLAFITPSSVCQIIKLLLKCITSLTQHVLKEFNKTCRVFPITCTYFKILFNMHIFFFSLNILIKFLRCFPYNHRYENNKIKSITKTKLLKLFSY